MSTLSTSVENASPAELAFFLQAMICEGKSASLVSQTVSTVSWHFQVSDRLDLTKHKVIGQLVAAARKIAPPILHKEPVGMEHLLFMRHQATEAGMFSTARAFLLSLTMYSSCSRMDDVISLSRRHI